MSDKPEFASSVYTAGQLNAVVKLLRQQGGNDGVERFLRGELTVSKPTIFLRDEPSVSQPSRSWREEDGVIYFSVTSDGTTGEEWIKRLSVRGYFVGYNVQKVLRSPNFRPSNGMTTEVAVLKSKLFKEEDRVTKIVNEEADKRKLLRAHPEVACLILLKFTAQEIEAMGLWYILAMLTVYDPYGDPSLLCAGRGDDGQWIDSFDGRPGIKWTAGYGFAYAVSQKKD